MQRFSFFPITLKYPAVKTYVMHLSFSDYKYSLACAVQSDLLPFYLLIYNPALFFSYLVHFDDLSMWLRCYVQLFEAIGNQYDSLSYDVYKLVDFNLRVTIWQTCSGSSHGSSGAYQWDGCHTSNWPPHTQTKQYSWSNFYRCKRSSLQKIVDKLFSNLNPIILSCSVSKLSAPEYSRNSRFSFDTLSFNSCLHDFFSYISRDNLTDPSFLDSWLHLLNLSTTNSLKKNTLGANEILLFFYKIHRPNQ